MYTHKITIFFTSQIMRSIEDTSLSTITHISTSLYTVLL